MTKLAKVQKAIEIQGYVTVSVANCDRQCRSISVVAGAWMTDILTSDLCGHVRIVKTKDALVWQAEQIIDRESEIRAARQEREAQAVAAMTN
jgi:hypothetical protein